LSVYRLIGSLTQLTVLMLRVFELNEQGELPIGPYFHNTLPAILSLGVDE